MKSVTVALAVIFVVMSLLFLSAKVGFIAMLPNIVPVMFFFGILGWSNIMLNIGTSIIAAIALGIAVDNTIHYMVRFNRELQVTLRRAPLARGRASAPSAGRSCTRRSRSRSGSS